MTIRLPDYPTTRLSDYYLAFTLDHDETAAAEAFHARYGRPPELVIESLGNLLLGPVPLDESLTPER